MSSICSILTNKTVDETNAFNNTVSLNNSVELNCVKKSLSFNKLNLYTEKISANNADVFVTDDIFVLFYGNVYNIKNVRVELSDIGYKFETNAIEEVLICAYKEWGDSCVKKFNGAFCFVLFDKTNNKIFFARDRLGKKNLYYYYKNNDLIISTELKAFFNCKLVETELNTEVLGRYMRLGFVPCPDSILKNVYKLSPGSYITITDSIVNEVRYWSPLQAYKENNKKKIKDYKKAKAELETLLKTCMQERLGEEKNFGVFLSSGIDSSLMAALATDISEDKITTYTIGVDDKKHNEAEIAKRIAEHLKSNHNEHYISEDEFLTVVPQIPIFYDEPFGDNSAVPSMILNRFIKDDLSIAIGGDGGDELFCGYPRYKALPKAQRFDFIGGILSAVLPSSIEKKLPIAVRRVVENRNKKAKSQMIMKQDLETYNKLLKKPFLEPYFDFENEFDISNWQIRRMVLDMTTTLSDDMIYKVEKAAQSFEVDVRAPMLDYRVVEFSFRLPQNFKYKGDITKFILRDLASDYIPQELLNAPKHGFSVPIAKWMRNNLKDTLMKYCEKDFVEEQGLFNYEQLNKLIEGLLAGNNKYKTICWNYLMFQLWYDKYMR